MTLLDTLRDRTRTRSPEDAPEPHVVDWWVAPASGALAAATSWLVLALPALVVWVVTAHTTVGWGDALGVAGAAWFLGHGAAVHVGDVGLTLAPLGLLLLALLVTARSARRLLDRTERQSPGTTWRGRLVRQVVPGFVLGYGAVAVLVGLLTLAGPARPAPLGVLPTLLVPVLALAWALLTRFLAGDEAGPVGLWLDTLPRWLPRALRPGVQGAGLLLGVGALLVAVMVVVRWSTVSGLHAAVDAGLVGGTVLTVAQLLVVPNLAVWGLAFLAGPGFQIADGAPITLSGAHPGLMPMIPVLGALPSDGTWPGWLWALLIVPVAAGGVLGWLGCRPLARLSSWRTKLLTAVTTAAVAAVCLTVLALLGSGAAGVERLQSVGTRPWLFGVLLLGELAVGAAAWVGLTQLLLRLRPHR